MNRLDSNADMHENPLAKPGSVYKRDEANRPHSIYVRLPFHHPTLFTACFLSPSSSLPPWHPYTIREGKKEREKERGREKEWEGGGGTREMYTHSLSCKHTHS